MCDDSIIRRMCLQHGCMCIRHSLDHFYAFLEVTICLPSNRPLTAMFRVHESTICMLYRLDMWLRERHRYLCVH